MLWLSKVRLGPDLPAPTTKKIFLIRKCSIYFLPAFEIQKGSRSVLTYFVA